MSESGRIRLLVPYRDGRVGVAHADAARPPAAAVLVGRPAAEAVALVPRLFSLCGQAQGHAARLALAAAQGVAEAALPLPASLVREAIGEHLWRLLLDWPAWAGDPPQAAELRRWRALLAADAAPLADELRSWLAGAARLPALPDPPAAAPCAPVALLPWASAARWADALPLAGPEGHARIAGNERLAAFARAPAWAGAPAETGALARQAAAPAVAAALAAGDRVRARLLARLADLRQLAAALADPRQTAGWAGSAAPAPGVGLARVETARGVLLHLMQVNDGRVVGYVIVAPTEWNFHPHGAFARELTGVPAADAAAAGRFARALALALDPCVAFEVVVEDA